MPAFRFRSAALLLPCLLLAACASLERDPLRADGMPSTPSGTVQGHDAASPLVEQRLVIEGTVTAALTGEGDSPLGWFVQDGGDDDKASSDALFVSATPEVSSLR